MVCVLGPPTPFQCHDSEILSISASTRLAEQVIAVATQRIGDEQHHDSQSLFARRHSEYVENPDRSRKLAGTRWPACTTLKR